MLPRDDDERARRVGKLAVTGSARLRRRVNPCAPRLATRQIGVECRLRRRLEAEPAMLDLVCGQTPNKGGAS